MKRIISLVLALATLAISLAVFTACAEKENTKKPGNTTDDVENQEDNYMVDQYDFGGDTITFPIFGSDSWYLNVEEKVGETVEDAVYDRDQLVKERLNVEIDTVPIGNWEEYKSSISTVLQAGDDDYDVILGQQANQISLCLDGYLLDLNDLGEYNAAGILNFEGDHWDDEYMEFYEFGNARYWLSGGFFTPLLGYIYCTFVNKTLYDKNFEQTYGDIYDLAYSGKWTLDVMAQMSSTIYNDVNGSEKLDAGDIVGWNYASASSCLMMGFLMGAGLVASTKNADGSINFLVTSTNTNNIEVIQKLNRTFTTTTGMAFDMGASPSGQSQFIEGNQLFFCGLFEHLNNFREMQDDFYIIPMPKFDENQTDYRSAVDDNNMIIGIPYCCADVQASVATIELLAYLAKKMVNDVYYGEALKYKFTRDDKAAEMIDFITAQMCTDFVFIWERWIFGEHWLRYNILPNPVSQIKKKEKDWIATFNETIKSLEGVKAGA